MPNSFSRFLTAEELQEFRRQYMDYLTAEKAEQEEERGGESEADPSQAQEHDR